jgi:hypothetical protein
MNYMDARLSKQEVSAVAELDNRWGEETIAVWNFLELAYRKGLLDELFKLVNTFTDPNMNPMDAMGDVEEKLSSFDFNALDAKLHGHLVPIMRSLTDEEAVEGLAILLQVIRSISELAIANMGGDVGEIARKAKMVGKGVKTVGLVLSPVLLQKAIPVVQLLMAIASQPQPGKAATT